jgi:hypothetical protein
MVEPPHQWRIAPGQAHNVAAFPPLMQEIDCDPEQMLGKKGYDSEAVRRDIAQRGGKAAIRPPRPGKYGMPSIRLSMSCAIASSASSIG